MHRLDAGKVSREHEERRKSTQKPPVKPHYCTAVKDEQQRKRHRSADRIRYGTQHHCDRKAEKRRIHRRAERLYSHRCIGNAKLRFRKQQAACEYERRRDQKRRQHYRNEIPCPYAVIAVQIKVLRVAEGRYHAAQISAAVLQHKKQRDVLSLPRAVKHEPAERQKGQQRRVVCEQHGSRHRYDNERRADASHAAEAAHETLRQRRKYVHVTQCADYRKHAEQAAQRFHVEVAEVFTVRGNEECGHACRQNRRSKHCV